MKKITFPILFSLLLNVITIYAQDCTELVRFAEFHLEEKEYSGPDYKAAYGLLDICANENNPNALNLLGLMYMHGQYVDVDENKGFELIKRSAEQGFHPAEYNLGRYYKWGKGCDIDFNQSVYWLQRSADHGNERAAYLLGYMYFKGFAVEQSYDKAVEWFEISEWPMARHWLGYCYYFGYGVPQNTEKALEILKPNDILNSKKLIEHIESNKLSQIETQNRVELEGKQNDKTAIIKESIPEKPVKVKEKINPKRLSGEWKGKFIEFDWSGEKILRVIPVSVEFKFTENGIDYSWSINNETSKDFGVWLDDALYFEKFHVLLDKPFSVSPVTEKMDWQILASHMEIKKFNNQTYLTGSLDTYLTDWKEPGPPTSIVLKKIKDDKEGEDANEAGDETVAGENDDELSEEALLSLLEQDDHFIKLYPNPFNTELLIQYELTMQGNVSVQLHDLSGMLRKNIQNTTLQGPGTFTYNIDGSDLATGLYIVNVYVNGKQNSKIVIKE